MIDEMDYVLVPEEGWGLLVQCFGQEEGALEVRRKVVEHGMFVKQFKVGRFLVVVIMIVEELAVTWKVLCYVNPVQRIRSNIIDLKSISLKQ